MPTRTAISSTTTTKKRTAKTSRYFTRAASQNDNKKKNEAKTKSSVSTEKVRQAKGESIDVCSLSSTAEVGSILSPTDGAGSLSCREVLSTATEASTSGQDESEHAPDGLGMELVIEDGLPVVNAQDPAEDDTLPRHDGHGDADTPIIQPTPSPQKQQKQQSPRKQPAPKLSPYFPQSLPSSPTKKPPPSSCLPFPPLSTPTFGLIQEQLSSTPFRLLIATIFLNRTRGPVAIPVLFQLFHKYPTINDMANANHEDIVSLIRGLGFQNQRATKFIALARKWIECPPARGRRYRKLNYPCKRDGRDVGVDEVVGDEDDTIISGDSEDGGSDQHSHSQKVAWEIAHLPGIGAYAIDSWRIFCRDRLRHPSPPDSNNDSSEKEYEPEWKRVLPQDKELRAYLTWLWLKEGWTWNCETGERTKADSEMMLRAEKGGMILEDGRLVLNLDHNDNSSGSGREDEGWVRRAGFSLDSS